MTKFILALLFSWSACTYAQEGHYMITGTYTSDKSEGIYIYKFNNEGEFSFASVTKNSNPSYLAVSPNQKFVYSVNEDAPGKVTAFSFNHQLGTLLYMNDQPSQGDHPCYISVDKTGKWIVVGNYSSGTLAVYPVKEDGSLDSVSQIIKHNGSSLNTERQGSPHIHSTIFSYDNQYLFVSDLGIDKVILYSFDDKTGELTTLSSMPSPPGSGPRHLDFHPSRKYVYVLEELTGSISVYDWKKISRPKLTQHISTLPQGQLGKVGSADIHVSPNGKFVYASNRGDFNSLAIFKINQKNGSLSLVGHQSTLGKTPRNFNFDPSGRFLLVANQNSNDIQIFSADGVTGLLTPIGKELKIDKPVCIKWITF